MFPAMGVFCQGAIMGSRILPDPTRRNRQSIWKPQWNQGIPSPHKAPQEIKSRKKFLYTLKMSLLKSETETGSPEGHTSDKFWSANIPSVKKSLIRKVRFVRGKNSDVRTGNNECISMIARWRYTPCRIENTRNSFQFTHSGT